MQRRTAQRDAIRRAVRKADRPLTPQEILLAAQQDVPRLGMATVYRAIKEGTGKGWFEVVDWPGGPPRYGPAGKKHHHHFECRVCGRLFCIDACPGDLQRLLPSGFKLEEHDLVLRGLCRTCTKKK